MKKTHYLLIPCMLILSSYSGSCIPVHNQATFTGTIQQPSLTGRFSMQSGSITLTLDLVQQSDRVTGTLKSSNGATFSLEGIVEGGGVATGVCRSDGGAVFFEVYLEGSELTLSLIEPDGNNQPDYDQAQYLLFNKVSSGSPSANQHPVTDALGIGEQTTTRKDQATHRQPQTNPSAITSQTGKPANQPAGMSVNEIGDKSWGFSFVPPEGWISNKTNGSIILGHNTIPGMIVVMPHYSGNLSEMQQEMLKGIQEEGVMLMPSGGLNQVNANTVTGNYQGTIDGQQVSAKGIGVLSPYTGGAYIIAVTTPESMGADLTAAAEYIGQHMKYTRLNNQDLMQHFSGKWANFTRNTATYIYLYPNGIYSNQYEASYAGNFQNDVGDVTGNWGATHQDSGSGRWTVRGNRDQGQIIIRLNNGEEIIYEYRVHIEKGQKYYSEYYFNGDYFMKEPFEK